MKKILPYIVAALVGAAVSFLLGGCAGNVPPVVPPLDPDQAAQLACLALCRAPGECQRVDGLWQCVKPTPPAPAPSCPATCPAGQECTDPALGCVAVTPPAPLPTPTPTPTPPPAPTCTLPDTSGWVQVPGAHPVREAEVASAIATLCKAEPTLFLDQCARLSAWDGGPRADTFFAKLAATLYTSYGLCGGQPVEGGQRQDGFAVLLPGDNGGEEFYHLINYGSGELLTAHNAWIRGGTYAPKAAPVAEACPAAPCPPKVFADTGLPHWRFNSHPHTMGNADTTPVVTKACDFCTAIGMGDNGTRCECPVRPDGHPERQAVENWLLDGGPVRDSKDGGDCTPNNTDNPYAVLIRGGNCRNCNTPRTVCTAWY